MSTKFPTKIPTKIPTKGLSDWRLLNTVKLRAGAFDKLTGPTWKVLVGLLCWGWMSGVAFGHVGNPNVVFEGRAGPYPVRVMIRPPGVVPGLAEIHVRVLTNGAEQVSVLPAHWKTGLKGAPPPDVAEPVPGEVNLYSAQLWLMTSGSYGVHVAVQGARGEGRVQVPVNSVATQRLAMSRGFGAMLSVCGVLLLLLGIAIIGAALRESVLEPGTMPTRARVWWTRAAMVFAACLLATGLWAGNRWWGKVDTQYRTRVLYQPTELRTELRHQGNQHRLGLELASPELGRVERTPLVPDHGKLMHLYLVREPSLNAFAHLHPVRVTDRQFDVSLPTLPDGRYGVYADVTHETGFVQTLAASLEIPEPPGAIDAGAFAPSDRDDSWHIGGPVDEAGGVQPLPGGYTMQREEIGPLVAGRDLILRFVVRDGAGQQASLKPYLGMFSHAILRAREGNLFMHLHPVGTISLAAQQVMALRVQDKDAAIVTAETLEPFCKDPPPEEGRRPLEFPCLIPEPGKYRIWVQCRPADRVVTAVFDLELKHGPGFGRR